MYGWQTGGVDQINPNVIAWKLAGDIYVFIVRDGGISKMTSVTLIAAQNSVEPASSGDRYSNYALNPQDDVNVVQKIWDNSLPGYSTIIWNVNTNYNVRDVQVAMARSFQFPGAFFSDTSILFWFRWNLQDEAGVSILTMKHSDFDTVSIRKASNSRRISFDMKSAGSQLYTTTTDFDNDRWYHVA